jgi:hypothetical protein
MPFAVTRNERIMLAILSLLLVVALALLMA